MHDAIHTREKVSFYMYYNYSIAVVAVSVAVGVVVLSVLAFIIATIALWIYCKTFNNLTTHTVNISYHFQANGETEVAIATYFSCVLICS